MVCGNGSCYHQGKKLQEPWPFAGKTLERIKGLYPKVSRLIRYDTRAAGKDTVHKWEQSMDEYFNDERMERIYPNGKAKGDL